MKKLFPIFVVLFILFSTSILAQEYDPVLKEGSFWDVTDYDYQEPCNFNQKRYEITNDTTMINKIYKKINLYPLIGEIARFDNCFQAPFILI